MNLIHTQKTWLSADWHLGHSNIIRYCNRPFDNPEQMEECLLDTFNSQLRKGDKLYNLGDVAWSTYPWERFLSRLNSREYFQIWGNHDKPQKEREKTPGVRKFADLLKLKMPGQSIMLCHYALRSWVGKREGVYHAFGHSHGCLPNFGKSMDVGIDAVGYRLIEWEEVDALLKTKEIDQEWWLKEPIRREVE